MNANDYEEPPAYTSADEKGLLASMLYDPACIAEVMRTIRATDFGDYQLRAVYESIIKRHLAGEVDPVGVFHDLKDHPRVENAQLLIADVGGAVTTAAHVATFASSVRDAALKRRIHEAAQTALYAASNGKAGEEVLADLLEFADSESRSTERRGGVEKFTLHDLVRNYPELNPPVVDGLIREGETCNIIAASKVGKSWFAYGLALAIANNERWLGRFDVSPGRVLLVDNELHRNTLSNRIPRVANAMGIPVDSIDRDLEVWPLRGNLKSLEDLAEEFDRIEPGEFKVVILDAKYRFASEDGDENSNSDDTRFYNRLDQLAAKTQSAFVLIHHSSKGDQSGKAVTDVGSGAGAQSRAADCHLVIRPHEEDGCAVLEAAVRSFAPIQPVVLRWAFPVWITDDRLDPQKLKGRMGKNQEAKSEEDKAAKALIVEKLFGGRYTNKDLRKLVGMGRERLGRLLDVLCAEGLVDSETTLKRGNECEEFFLTGDVDDVDGPRPVHVESGTEAVCVAAPKGGPSTPPGSGPGADRVLEASA